MDIVRFIRGQFQQQNYVTQRDILRCTKRQFGKVLTYGWMGRFLDRHADEVSPVTVAPQGQLRLEVPRCYLDDYITLLKKIIPIVPSELVVNFDETGLSAWEDRKIKPILVPAAEEDSTLHYPGNRNIRHHTLMCCVHAAGNAYCSMLIAPNAEATQIFDTGARDHIGLVLEIRRLVYAAGELFARHIEEIFFPAVEANRQLPGCQDKLCLSFCDNCSIHGTESILRRFAEKGVAIITYPAHMSHIFQILDVLLFRRLKAAKKYVPRDDTAPAGIDHLVRIFKAHETVTTSTMVRGPWSKAGFEHIISDGVSYLVVNEGKISDSPDFSQLWRIDFPMMRLSERRRGQKSGFMTACGDVWPIRIGFATAPKGGFSPKSSLTTSSA
jgi:hypothetical protein